MKKTLTAMALVTSILPLSNTSNAETETDLPELNSDNPNNSDLNNTSEVAINKQSLSVTITKDNAYLIDEQGNKVVSANIGDKFQVLKKLDNEPFTKIHFNGHILFLANEFISNDTTYNTSETEYEMNSLGKVRNISNEDILNVRNTDSILGKILFNLNTDSVFKIIERTNNGWYKIDYYGNYGYVNSEHIELVNTFNSNSRLSNYSENAKASFTVTNMSMNGIVYNVASNDTLNVRKTPSSSGAIITKLKNNSTVKVTGLTSNNWYRVNINGTTGYASKKYIKESAPKTTKYKVINGSINLRTTASWSGSIYETAKAGTVLDVVGINGPWATIYKNNRTLYAPSNYLVPLSDSPVVDESKPNFTVSNMNMDGVVYNVSSNDVLNVRGTPYSSGKLVTTLKNNTRVKVTGITSNNWYRVNINGTTGYVDKSYVKEYIPQTNKYKVINGSINLRTTASWGGSIYEVAKAGTILDVVSINGDWATIYKDKKTLYAPASHLESLASPPVVEDPKPNFTVSNLNLDGVVYNISSNNVLNVRETPYSSGKLVTTLKNNARVKVTGITSNGWYRVNINGTVGYADKNYIKEYAPETTKYKVINGSINLRTTASWSGDVYETVKVGTVLDVIEINGAWATIYKDKKTLFAPSNYLESLTAPPVVEPTPPVVEPTPPVEEESKPNFTVSDIEMDGVVCNVSSNDVLNVREVPDASGKLVTTLKNNTRVKVTGITSNNWYRVNINGTVGYANKKYIAEYIPQTTKYKVINGSINLRTTASWSGSIYETAKVGTILDIIEINGGWATVYKDKKTLYAPSNYLALENQGSDSETNTPQGNILYTKYPYTLSEYIKVQASRSSAYDEARFESYINPAKCNKFEFLRLNEFRNLDVNKVNSMLSSQNAGVLIGKGQAFLNTCKKYNIDPLYFIAQSIHETGYGKSTLAKGVTITEIANPDRPIKDSNGDITGYEMIPLSGPTTVYNLFGIGAYDNLPTMPNRALILGTTYAYNKGWTSVEKAIDGAGSFVSSGYINSSKYNQNTIYKMKYNHNSQYIWHQYATTPWYSRDIAKFMDKYQDFYISPSFTFDKPLFIGMSEYSLEKTRYTDNAFNADSFGKEDITLQ